MRPQQRGRSRDQHYLPRPTIAKPRPALLSAVLAFVRSARTCRGVRRIALLGSLATEKPIPKDADVLVTIDPTMDLADLARIGRRLKGSGQQINLGADIFLADENGEYLGRICHYRECHARALCRARNCGRRQHLNDDLHVVTLAPNLIAAPPIDLWPNIVRRIDVPGDVDELLLAALEQDSSPSP